MDKKRLLIEVTGSAIYLSHLDRMRTFQRAFSRGNIALYHTEGFNPHPYISFALPLPVGMESVCEILDFETVDDTKLADVPALLNPQLPQGISVLEAYESPRKIKELSHLSLESVWEYDSLSQMDERAEKLQDFFTSADISVRKLNKKKQENIINIAPLIKEISFTPQEGHIQVKTTLAAQNPGLNPNLLVEALKQNNPGLTPDFASFRRLAVLDSNLESFR